MTSDQDGAAGGPLPESHRRFASLAFAPFLPRIPKRRGNMPFTLGGGTPDLAPSVLGGRTRAEAELTVTPTPMRRRLTPLVETVMTGERTVPGGMNVSVPEPLPTGDVITGEAHVVAPAAEAAGYGPGPVGEVATYTAQITRSLTSRAPRSWQAQLVAADTPTKIRLLAIERVQAEVLTLIDAGRYETRRELTSLEHVYYVLADVHKSVKAETGYSELSSDLDLITRIGEFFTRSPKHQLFGHILIQLAGKWDKPDELIDRLLKWAAGG